MSTAAGSEAHPPTDTLPECRPAANPATREYARARLAEISRSLGAPQQRQPDRRTATHRAAIAKFLLFAFAKTRESEQ